MIKTKEPGQALIQEETTVEQMWRRSKVKAEEHLYNSGEARVPVPQNPAAVSTATSAMEQDIPQSR